MAAILNFCDYGQKTSIFFRYHVFLESTHFFLIFRPIGQQLTQKAYRMTIDPTLTFSFKIFKAKLYYKSFAKFSPQYEIKDSKKHDIYVNIKENLLENINIAVRRAAKYLSLNHIYSLMSLITLMNVIKFLKCDKRFTAYSIMSRHDLIHKEECPFACCRFAARDSNTNTLCMIIKSFMIINVHLDVKHAARDLTVHKL